MRADATDKGADVTLAREVWVDAQLPPALAGWLRDEHQVDAHHVADLGMRAASDRRIFEDASEAGAVVMTKDSDFVGLVLQRGAPPQVVWLRLGNTSNRDLRRVVLSAWPDAAALLAGGEPLVEIRRRVEPL